MQPWLLVTKTLDVHRLLSQFALSSSMSSPFRYDPFMSTLLWFDVESIQMPTGLKDALFRNSTDPVESLLRIKPARPLLEDVFSVTEVLLASTAMRKPKASLRMLLLRVTAFES